MLASLLFNKILFCFVPRSYGNVMFFLIYLHMYFSPPGKKNPIPEKHIFRKYPLFVDEK